MRNLLGFWFDVWHYFRSPPVPLLVGIVILPMTFLGGTHYSWTTLAPVQVGGIHWLQILVLVNPLIYINEGFRAALTGADHMSLLVIYPVLGAFCLFFLWTGIRGFRKRLIS